MDAATRSIERYRSFLRVLARAHLRPALRGRIEPSDLVQETLLEAHRDAGDLRGRSPAQRAAWLRRILLRNLADALRRLGREKRDPARERSLDDALRRSRLEVAALLADELPTPSALLVAEERVLALAAGLERLPEDQARALALRYWEGLPLTEIAERLERSPAAAAGLLQRGLARLRTLLRDLDPR